MKIRLQLLVIAFYLSNDPIKSSCRWCQPGYLAPWWRSGTCIILASLDHSSYRKCYHPHYWFRSYRHRNRPGPCRKSHKIPLIIYINICARDNVLHDSWHSCWLVAPVLSARRHAAVKVGEGGGDCPPSTRARHFPGSDWIPDRWLDAKPKNSSSLLSREL